MNTYTTEILEEYAKIREQNEEKHKQLTEKIYTHLPRVKEIDEEITNAAINASTLVLEKKVAPEVAVADMKKKIDALVKEKNELLESIGFPLDYADTIYTCKLCKDTGFTESGKCVCYQQKLNKYIQKKSNFAIKSSNSFENFDINLYSDKPDERYGIAPKERMRVVLKTALDFADDAPSAPQNLLFYGNAGLGKTFLSDCIAKKYIESGKTVFYMSAQRIFNIYEDYRFGRMDQAEAKEIINSIECSELLIIDDLGTEFKTPYSESILFDILNSRINKNAKMIVNTNLTPKELKHFYSERISSRILGNFEEVLFFGDDIRMKIKK